jgi:hypothetical protein
MLFAGAIPPILKEPTSTLPLSTEFPEMTSPPPVRLFVAATVPAPTATAVRLVNAPVPGVVAPMLVALRAVNAPVPGVTAPMLVAVKILVKKLVNPVFEKSMVAAPNGVTGRNLRNSPELAPVVAAGTTCILNPENVPVLPVALPISHV